MSTNVCGLSIDRSTCVSAARLSTPVGRCLVEDPRHRGAVRDIGLYERDTRILERIFQVEKTARIGQLVDDDDSIGGVRKGVAREVRSDEPRAAGDEKCS